MEVEISILINASDKTVWNILTSFDAYPEWNTYITYIEGDLTPGSSLYVETRNANDNHSVSRPRVKKMVWERELRWQGQLLTPGVYDSERSFAILPVSEDRVSFTIRGNYTGLLVPIFGGLVKMSEAIDYGRMSEELKIRAEDTASDDLTLNDGHAK